MPCRSGYDDEVQVVIREKKVVVGNKELQEELRKSQEEVRELTEKTNAMIKERNTIKRELDEMTRAFCVVTNRLFDYDAEYLEMILEADQALRLIFEEHQKLDRASNRPYLWVGKDGKRRRFNKKVG